MTWLDDLQLALSQDQDCVLVTLNVISGSSPRASGSRMIVTSSQIMGSIGGGNLEYQATQRARDLLEKQKNGHQEQELYGLGPALNQCCGGAVALLYEVIAQSRLPWLALLRERLSREQPSFLLSRADNGQSYKTVVCADMEADPELPENILAAALDDIRSPQKMPAGMLHEIKAGGETWWLESIRQRRRPVMLFGAGHVGQAVARALSPLPFRLSWVDSRPAIFPDRLPENVISINPDSPPKLVARAPPDSIFIVMTHSHQLDEDICFEVFRRKDFRWLGLIGSATKRRRFVHRLEQRGIDASRLQALVCPIGLSSIRGKQPATIALSLAAQLMTEHDKSVEYP